MDQAKAERALAAVRKKYSKYLSFDNNADYPPKLMKDWGLGTTMSAWAIVWEEGSPDDWALKWNSARRDDPLDVCMEPLCSFALGVYDGTN